MYTFVIFTLAPHSSAHNDGCGPLKKKKVGHPRCTGTDFPQTPWSGHASYISDSGKFPVFYGANVFVTLFTKAC